MKAASRVSDTRRLFAQLLRPLQITDVCDIGSMNGADALVFRSAAPRARVYAFEPNPYNLQEMAGNPALRDSGIEMLPLAVTNYDGEAEFFLVEADYSRLDARRGMSSLYSRSDEWAPVDSVRVRTTRLDTFLADRCPPHMRLALWIDTEGKAYEVIEGTKGVAEQVRLLHVEVETQPCIGQQQKLYPQVKALLHHLGFVELATDNAADKMQFNALFVRCGPSCWTNFRVTAYRIRVHLRYLLIRAVGRVCPACLDHLRRTLREQFH